MPAPPRIEVAHDIVELYRLVRQLQPYILRNIAADADDIVMSVVLQLWGKFKASSGSKANIALDKPVTRAYAATVLRHAAVDHHRRERREQARFRHLDELDVANLGADRSPAEETIDDEMLKRLRKATASLNRAERRALTLIYGFGLSSEEASKELGISKATLYQRLRRGRLKLRGALLPKREP